MRARLAAALMVLAACSVKLEGGRCKTDQNGLDDERCDTTAGRCVRCQPEASCPAQDLTCADGVTVRTCLTNHGGCRYLASLDTCATPFVCQDPGTAASCVCPPGGPNAGDGCATASQTACDATSNVLTCAQVGTCLVWTAASPSCAAQGLVCGAKGGPAACTCPAYGGSDFYADSSQGSSAAAPPYATGAPSPAVCRFKTLAQALAKAGSVTPPASVRATGWTSGPPMAFSKAGGETFPLVVPNGVTLRTSDTVQAPANYVISIDDAAALSGVELHDGATLSGLLVQSTAATGAGVRLVCAAGLTSASIQSAKIDGAGLLAEAVSAGGSCGAQLNAVDAGGAKTAALLVDAPAGTVAVTGGLFHGSKVGIQVNRGSATLASVEVANNTSVASGGVGILAGNMTGAAAGDIHLAATSLLVHDNDDTGLQLANLSVASTVSIATSKVYFNKALTNASVYGPVINKRKAGGVLLVGASPGTFTFQANRVSANKTDQVGVDLSSGTWSLSAGSTACTANPVTANVFTCHDGVYGGYLVYSQGATVDAQYNFWEVNPPTSYVTVTVNAINYCGADTTCP